MPFEKLPQRHLFPSAPAPARPPLAGLSTLALTGLMPLSLLFCSVPTAAWAQAPQVMQGSAQSQTVDPPGRVAWLDLVEGAVSFESGGPDAAAGNQWTTAQPNRPITGGDRLWTGRNARSELHIGSTAVRMGGDTRLDLAQLDDDTTSLRLPQGTINLRVRALFEGQRLEVRTPNLAFVVQQPGDYRLDVNPSANTTRVVVLSGAGQVYGDSGVPFALGDRQQSSFTGTQLAQVMLPGATIADTFDAWASERNRLEDQSVSARYVPREVTGYQQLDAYGDWREDPSYGAVWFPRAVPSGWAPYSAGRWDWISPWGWTWIDNAPWGFAPFHYGRWTQIGPRWAWAPGRLAPRPVYAPALVGFIGASGNGASWNITAGGGRGPGPGPALGWFPLAPGEAFRPHYYGSPRYVSRLNNNIVINNNVSINSYRFQRMPGAVTAIRTEDFRRGRPVMGSGIVSAEDLRRAQLVDGNRGLPQGPGTQASAGNPRPQGGLLPPAVNAGSTGFGGGRDPGRNDREQLTGRNNFNDFNDRDQAERRARLEQAQRQQRQQQQQQQQQHELQRIQSPQPGFAVMPSAGSSPQENGPSDSRVNRDRNGRPGFDLPQWQNQRQLQLQNEQLRRQLDAQRRLEIQRREPESIGQQALREAAQRDEAARRGQMLQQQKDQAAQRAREQATQGQARQAQEQQRQQMQRAAQSGALQRQPRPQESPGVQGGRARPDAGMNRPQRSDGEQRRQPP
ncbi:MAG: chromosome partitioning protein ParA [Comamonadaceae bacterium]|nr:MAG: chromosome partitioning protein ParA [Comamonadaceae bacterium]